MEIKKILNLPQSTIRPNSDTRNQCKDAIELSDFYFCRLQQQYNCTITHNCTVCRKGFLLNKTR